MQKTFYLEELQKKIKENNYKEGDRIYCNIYPNYIFIYENGKFVGYYHDGHDLFGDGPLEELIKDKNFLMNHSLSILIKWINNMKKFYEKIRN